MISVSGLSVSFGDRTLFSDVSFFITEKDTVGLVGKNGAGKSTLLKVLAGIEKSTSGDVSFPKETTFGYLPQDLTLHPVNTVYEEAATAFEQIHILEHRSKEVSDELANREDFESEAYLRLIEELNVINDRLQILDAGNMAETVTRILTGLGFSLEDLSMPLSTFSGGWQMRVELAKLLLQQPSVLLLDEPTNHLDILSIQWL
jgi:ATP-binding cassette subfamily F protein 3